MRIIIGAGATFPNKGCLRKGEHPNMFYPFEAVLIAKRLISLVASDRSRLDPELGPETRT